jgi:ABC-type glycerol-3-phosphate transport system permease component
MAGFIPQADRGAVIHQAMIRAGRVLRVLLICLVMVIYVGPFYISFLYSIKNHTDISRNRLAWPESPTISNYINVMTRNKIGRAHV